MKSKQIVIRTESVSDFQIGITEVIDCLFTVKFESVARNEINSILSGC